MARIVRTASAKADVLVIAEYIARDKPDAAERWVEALDNTLIQIAKSPLMGE
jgi:plasmid stabilization system protein ParE